MPGISLDQAYGFFQGMMPFKIIKEFLVSNRIQGIQIFIFPAGFNLIQQSQVHHSIDTLVDPRVQFFAFKFKTDLKLLEGPLFGCSL